MSASAPRSTAPPWMRAWLPALVCVLFALGAWRDGAFFGSVFFPGAIAVFALFALLVGFLPGVSRPSRPALVAWLALLGLGIWAALACIWSPDPAVAVEDAFKAFVYAAVFGLGFWVAGLLGRRVEWALAPVAVAGVLVGVGTTITIATGHDITTYLDSEATLRFPFGYRNADAAFFMICIWALVNLAAGGRARWPLRAASLAGLTMMIELVVLAQSRGSLPAAVVALVVCVAFAPDRLRLAAYLAVAVLPVGIALPDLLAVFHHGRIPGALPLLRSASHAIILTTVISGAFAAFVLALVEPRIRIGATWRRRISVALLGLAVVGVAVGLVGFFVQQGGPAHFIDQRVSEFNRDESPSFENADTRFGVNISSERSDLWRVAADEFADHPLVGGGPGSFQFAYLRERRTAITPRDPHSVEMLMLSEQGLVGFALLVAFVIAAVVAALGARGGDRSAAVLAAGALAAGSYWLVHSSYDWFWRYPAVTALAIFLLGAAAFRAAPAVRWARSAKALVLAALAVLALAAVPVYLGERYTSEALQKWREDPVSAYDDLDASASLNPFDAEPLLVKGVIADKVGDHALAIKSFRKAEGRVPESYVPHYYLGKALQTAAPAAARREAAEALRLNPHGPEVIALSRALRKSRDVGTAGREGSSKP